MLINNSIIQMQQASRMQTVDECLRRYIGSQEERIKSGPEMRSITIEINDEWLGLSENKPIPLYVGKTSSGIHQRIGKHLMLGTNRIFESGKSIESWVKPTTTCQLRAGIEHRFPMEENIRSLILENIGLSYAILDGDEHAANRFYLENLAIGCMLPVINLDIER